MEDKFKEECMKKKEVVREEGAVVLKTEVEMRNKADELIGNSGYFLEGAKTMLKSKTPYLAITLGFFSIENMANALIALNGYTIRNHICTQIFLSRVLNEKKLASMLSNAENKRVNFNYRMNLKSIPDKTEAEKFINEIVMPFIENVNKLIKKK